MMQVYLIVNPKSGKGLKVFKHLQNKLTIPYTSYLTKYPTHATELTEQIKKEAPQALIIAVGGDGTINEIVNGAVNSELTIGAIESGSGNDFARYFYCFKTPEDIEQFIANQKNDQTDVGKVISSQTEKYFINNSGLGFDALICERVARSKFKYFLNKISLGKLVYLYYVMQELIRFKPFQLTVESDMDSRTYEDVWFVTASNQPYFGGGMKISPHSDAKDGQLEYTIAHQLGKIRFLMIFWKVFQGNHLKYTKYVKQMRGASCQVEANNSLFGHVDGEFYSVDLNEKLTFSAQKDLLKRATDQTVTKGVSHHE